MRTLLIAFRAIIFVDGIFLWCGNVFGFFRTFPFAGYLTLVIGGITYKAGQKIE